MLTQLWVGSLVPDKPSNHASPTLRTEPTVFDPSAPATPRSVERMLRRDACLKAILHVRPHDPDVLSTTFLSEEEASLSRPSTSQSLKLPVWEWCINSIESSDCWSQLLILYCSSMVAFLSRCFDTCKGES
mmetsp:Transcript_68578/g.200651  ORF Transcript_68578/g.200651 Transcript_68578/m.200651 type:complete len:131 (-) Transcript_68578:39-431(-)